MPSSNKNTRKYKKNSFKDTRKKMRKIGLPIVYGKVYADWCGHCRAMETDWKYVKQKMGKIKSFDIEQKMESVLLPKFKEIYGTDLYVNKGYPTIYKLYKKGGPLEFYEGPRNFKYMVDWINQRPNPKMSVNKPIKSDGFFANLFQK